MPPNISNDPEYIELVKFLIEKTKNAKSSMNLKQLAEEFKETSGSSQQVSCLNRRIGLFRSKIHRMDSIDSTAKVRMLVALGASIDKDLLDKLRTDAHVEVDEYKRITKYIAKDGSLEMKGDHSGAAKRKSGWDRQKQIVNLEHWETDPEYIELMKFLIEKTKDVKSLMSLTQLAEEFKENSGSSRGANCLRQRIMKSRSRIHRMDSIDTAEKVKMLVALGGSIDMDFLNELRMDAHVEVDEYKRITKYLAKDGSLELEGDHSVSTKSKLGWNKRKQNMNDSLNNSDNGLMNPITKPPRSVKRAAAAEVPSSSKRTKSASPTRVLKSKDYAPDDSIGSPKSSGSRTKEAFSPKISKLEAPDDSPRIPESRAKEPENPGVQLLRRPKLEEAPEASGSPGTSGASPRQEAPIFKSVGAPRASRAPLRPKSEENTESEADDSSTPLFKFLETIQSFVFTLNTPSLTPIQAKIGKKLRELSPYKKIANDEMSLAIGLIVAKLFNYSVPILSENVESVRFSHFLCYLNAAIMNSKLEGLEVLMKNIKIIIEEPDKRIPVEKVAIVLQDTLNNVCI